MKRLQVVRESESDSAYALVIYENNQATAIAVTDDASAWAEWVNSSSMNMKQLNESLSHALYTGNARILTDEILTQAKSLYGDHLLAEITSNDSEPTHEVVDAVVGHGRLYRPTAIRSKSMPAVSSARLSTISSSSRQAAIEYKALSYRSESTYSRLNFEMKKVRAVWDPDLGPSGGWRCPSGSQFGGYITDRFGRGCGGGIIRRVGRALVNAGRRIDNIGEQRQLRRLNRAAERAQKPGVGERAGDAIRRGAGQAAVALERGAQRLVGEYQPRDYVPNVGMRRQRRVGVPNVPEGRKREIDDRLQAISRELDDLVDETPTPAVEKRIAELIRENRALRRERDGGPNGRAIVRPAGRGQGVNRPVPARPALPNRGQNRNVNRPERRQGARPVRKPVAERQRDGVMERAARGLVGGYNPDEYKPGDKKRIKNRENRYAKVKDEALLRALDVNRPRPLRPGEGRDVEARRRQERLEILQEMVNRRMEIPDAYKREVRVYKLKPQRKQRRDGLNRQGRAAVALERAAQRVLGGEERQPRNIPVDGIDAQTRRIANARKNRPANISDSDWQQYNEYLDSIPDGNLLIPGEAPQLEPVLSFNAWKKNVQPNQSVPRVRPNRPNAPQARKPVPKPVPKAPSVKKNLDGFSDDELLKILKKHKEKDPVPFEVADLSDEDLARLMDLLDTNQTIFLRNNQGLEPRDGYRLVFEEFNHRQDNGLWKTPKTPKAPVSVRARSRSARVQQAVSTPIRRPQPKRQRGKMLDAAQLDADQNFRLKRLVMDEKARLDADWRKRLGLGANEPVTSRAIKDYIKQRENNKPGAYIGVLKANANDWDVLNDLEQQINRRPPRAALNPDHIDLINKVGPKRRQKFIDGANASTAGRIRSNRPTRTPKPPVSDRKPRFTPPSSQFNAPPPGMSPSEAVKLRKHPDYIWRGTVRSNALKKYRDGTEEFVGTGLFDVFDWRINQREELQRETVQVLQTEKSEARRAQLLYRYNQATDELAILRDAKKRHLAILDKNRRDANKAPSAPKAPTPKPNAPANPERVVKPQPDANTPEAQPEYGNALNVLVPDTPRKRVKQVPKLGEDGTPDNPMPVVRPRPNSKIKNSQDAVKWLNDGNSIEDIPRDLWWAALVGHVSPNNKGKKQYMEVVKNGGIIGDTKIFVALDAKGQPTGMGFVLKHDKDDDRNNVNAVLNFQLANALGINVDAAGFDGPARGRNGVPAAIIPFAWNRAPQGQIVDPKAAGLKNGAGFPNFTPQQFAGEPDKAHPQRLAGFLLNYILQVPDRHDQNHMGAMVGGKPMVIPIDLDWGARRAQSPMDLGDYQRAFWADGTLLRSMNSHLKKLPQAERAKQIDDIMNVYDGMIERGRAIKAGGRDAFVKNAIDNLPDSQLQVFGVADAVKTRAGSVYDQLSLSIDKLINQRNKFLAGLTAV